MRLACVQLAVEGGDVEGNVGRALEAIDRAAAAGADLVALPELFDVGYFAFDAYAREAESLDGPRLSRFADRAATHGVAILAGTIVEDLEGSAADGIEVPADEGLANTAVLFDANGRRSLVYRKHHLFGYGSVEDELLVPGESVETASVAGMDVGVTTCYDLRFPELYREMVDEGLDLALVPSAWPYPRVEHWNALPKARAIENLSYVAAINGSGTFEDAELVGRTTVYDPWGTVLASSSDGPTIVFADVDPDRVRAVRDEFPALADRRL